LSGSNQTTWSTLSPPTRGIKFTRCQSMIPDGAQPLDAKMSQDNKATFAVPVVCVIVCRPHMFIGMISVVLVGDPINIDKLDPAAFRPEPGPNSKPCSSPSRKVEQGQGTDCGQATLCFFNHLPCGDQCASWS